MITATEVRKAALSLPKTEEASHWGKVSFRINGKIFVIIQPDGETITVKTTKEERELYTKSHPNTFRTPESFSNMNFMHINLASADEAEVKRLIQTAWGLVAPKKLVKAYFDEGGLTN